MSKKKRPPFDLEKTYETACGAGEEIMMIPAADVRHLIETIVLLSTWQGHWKEMVMQMKKLVDNGENPIVKQGLEKVSTKVAARVNAESEEGG